MRLTLPKRICGRFKPGGAPFVRAPQPRPLIRIIPVFVQIPARATGVPDRAAERGAKLAVEQLSRLALDLDRRCSLAVELAERHQHVLHPGVDPENYLPCAVRCVLAVEQAS